MRNWGLALVAGAVVAGLAGCAGGSGDDAACDDFRKSADTVASYMAGDMSSEATKAAYRDAQATHSANLRKAASEAASDELASNLNQAADLWDSSVGNDDASTAYFLVEEDIRSACD